jgi:hypothetical protein
MSVSGGDGWVLLEPVGQVDGGVLAEVRPEAAGAGHPFDTDEAGRAVGPRRLQEVHESLAGMFPGEALLDVDPVQRRAVIRFAVPLGRRACAQALRSTGPKTAGLT